MMSQICAGRERFQCSHGNQRRSVKYLRESISHSASMRPALLLRKSVQNKFWTNRSIYSQFHWIVVQTTLYNFSFYPRPRNYAQQCRQLGLILDSSALCCRKEIQHSRLCIQLQICVERYMDKMMLSWQNNLLEWKSKFQLVQFQFWHVLGQ